MYITGFNLIMERLFVKKTNQCTKLTVLEYGDYLITIKTRYKITGCTLNVY